MKKKLFILLIAIVAIASLTACSSKTKEATGDLKLTERNMAYIEEYDKSIQKYLEEMSQNLKTFNDSLDGLYTQEYSKEQFGQAVKTNIEKSNKLVTEIESVDVTPDLFEANQKLLELVNRTHQLFLRAMDMSNREKVDIDKNGLRNEYVAIKTSQANLANQWKILRDELESGKQEEK